MNVFSQEIEKDCPYCGLHIKGNRGVYTNHLRWCKENPKYKEILDKTKKNLSNGVTNFYKSKNGEIKEFKVICRNCNKEFFVKEPENKFPLKKYYYCSSYCSHAHNKFIENVGENISNGFLIKSENYKIYYKNRFNKEYDISKKSHKCLMCNNIIIGKNKFCSILCRKKYNLYKNIPNILQENEKNKIKEIKKLYKYFCRFNFALNEYPDEFDFDLIRKYGWYKAKNHGNNLGGVSRDHRFSCNEAFKKLIDPYLISHPVNCQLLRHNDNSSKNVKCSISLEELKEKINEWNIKYGKYENKIDYELFEKLNIKFNY